MRRNALMGNLEQRRGCELGESNKNLRKLGRVMLGPGIGISRGAEG
jgi:hypothetical protein